MVSRWMPNGSILGYVTKYPGANRLELVSLPHWKFYSALTGLQLVGVVRGLGYLHSNEVVHGDLKSVRGVYPAAPSG
jgi:serine/threonine protein kinase